MSVTIIVKKNIAYQSPITGEPITTWRQRQYDMESHDCMDAREAKECAADARKYWKTGIEDLTLEELEAKS